MKKSLWLAVGAVAVVVVLLVAFNRKGNVPAGQFTIGGLLPLTGDLADFGQEINRGALIAVEELNATGAHIQYISEDDAFDPAKGVSAANKLLQTDKVQAVFTAVGEEEKPVAPLFNAAKVPLLVAWDSNEALKKAGDYIFSFGFSTEADGALMADYAYNSRKLRNIVIVHTVDPVGEIMGDSFTREFTAKGGVILDRQKIQPTQTDHRTTVAKIKSENPDGLYIIMIPPQNSSFLPQLQRAGFKGEVLSADSLIQSEIHNSGTAANGVYYTNTFANRPDILVEKYKQKFGKEPSDTTLVSFGYDSIKILAEAFRIASEKHISIRDALTTVKLDGLGASIDMKGTQFSERFEKIYQVQNGVPVPIQ
jgi:branched-chain amino acid transport system substrate-binding protein